MPRQARCGSWTDRHRARDDRQASGTSVRTDGEGVNASLRPCAAVESPTDERAAELLADKRAKGPALKKPPSARRVALLRRTLDGVSARTARSRCWPQRPARRRADARLFVHLARPAAGPVALAFAPRCVHRRSRAAGSARLRTCSGPTPLREVVPDVCVSVARCFSLVAGPPGARRRRGIAARGDPTGHRGRGHACSSGREPPPRTVFLLCPPPTTPTTSRSRCSPLRRYAAHSGPAAIAGVLERLTSSPAGGVGAAAVAEATSVGLDGLPRSDARNGREAC